MTIDRSDFALSAFAVFAFLLAAGVSQSQLAQDKNQFLIPPPEHLEHFHFGFRESMADSFWLRWIQDADNCQTYIRPVEFLEMPKERPDRLEFNPRHKVCDQSWAFKMLDTVTKLAPRFRMPYHAGAITLSVITEDYVGATEIFRRGLEAYPNDWEIGYRAAYHFLFDLGDKERAAELLAKIGAQGGPIWAQSLASKLFSETGQLELGLRTLENYRRGLENPKAIADVDQRIQNLKSRLARAQGTKGP